MLFVIPTYEQVIWGDTADMGDLPQEYGVPIHTGITGSKKESLSERIPGMVYGITPTQSPHKYEDGNKPKSLSKVIVGPHSQATSPKKLTKEILGRELLKVPSTKINKNGEREGDLGMVEPEFYDFYIPDKKGTVLSGKEIIDYNEQSLAGNSAYMIDMPKLRVKYGPNSFILDRKTRYMYTRKGDCIIQTEEKVHIFQVELMTLTGGPDNEGQSPTRTMHLTNMKNTPNAESTRVPIKSSTDERGESKVPMPISLPF